MSTHLNNLPELLLSKENIDLLFPETIQDLMCLHKMNGEYLYISSSVKNILGYTSQEMIDTFQRALVLPEEQDKFNWENNQFIVLNEKNDFKKYRIRKKDNTYVWFETFTILLKDKNGNPACLQTISKTINDQTVEPSSIQATLKRKEKLLSKITESAPLAYYIVDERTDAILHFNRRFCQMWGAEHLEEDMQAGKLKNTVLLSHIAPLLKEREDLDSISNPFKSKSNLPVVELEVELVTGHTYKTFASYLFDGDEYSATLYTFEDITQRKLSDEKLKNTYESLAEAQRIARFGNWEFDLQTQKITWSEELFHIYGLPAVEVAPSFPEMLKLIHPADLEMFLKVVEDCTKHGVAYDINYRIMFADETIKHIHCIGTPVISDNKSIIGLKGISHEITQQKQTEEQLIKAKELAEHSVKLREQFLANMSHEIRTPLNGIVGMAHLLSKTTLDSEQKQFMEAIKFSADNLMVIINDILDLAKIEAGKMHIEEAPLIVKQIVKNIAGMFSIKTAEKNIELEIDIDNSIPDSLLGDSVRLNQILLNLVGNAVKFTQEGSVKVKVVLEKEINEQVYLRFSVIDTGIGIPEDKLDYIFEIFTQATTETTRNYGGTGLGLPICKKLIELQKGKIKVKSRLNVGSEFIFIIPYKKEKQTAQESKVSLPVTDAAMLPESMRILLAEDNEINRLIVLTMLKRWKQIKTDVDVAANGKEVLHMLNIQDYDLILMDCQMPDMDGYKATRIIRTELSAPKCNVPIIAVTASALQQDKEKVFEAGMDDFIPKPFEQADLFEKILSVARRKKQGGIQDSSKLEKSQVERGFQEKLFDLSFLKSIAGDDLLELHEIIEKFIEKFPSDILVMEQASVNKEYKEMSSYAHKLKANIKFFGIEKLYSAIEWIEKAGQESETYIDVHALAHHINLINQTAEKVIEGLKKEMKEMV